MPTFLGPFAVTLVRSQVIDYTIPVYIDDMTGLLSLEIKKDQAVLIRPFDWRVWTVVFTLTPIFALLVFLSDRFYDGHAKWYPVFDFIVRHGCQMAIAGFLESYVFGPSGFWTMAPLRWIAPPRPPPWRNPRKGRDKILQRSVAEP